MRVLITDPSYKHAMALARYLKEYDPSIETVAAFSYLPKFPRIFSRHYDRMLFGPLAKIINEESHDLLIPVGNASVEQASVLKISTALLPPPESLRIALDKGLTLEAAARLGVPTPKTICLQSGEDLRSLGINFPCVVKGVLEAGKNVVSYPRNDEELERAVAGTVADSTQKGALPMIQEYVPGVGLGFFAFYQKGELKRFYMHQRVREYPITGGASTAAKTIYHPEAFSYGKLLLDSLGWHGPAMVEFKYDPASGRLALMEINPKFWGSTELGLAAGVNFGELLARAVKGEEIPADLSPASYKEILFCWPFEGDLAAIWQSGCWGAFYDYWSRRCSTNVKANGFLLNCFRFAEFLRGQR